MTRQALRQAAYPLHDAASSAVEPIERMLVWPQGEEELPETYPSAV